MYIFLKVNFSELIFDIISSIDEPYLVLISSERLENSLAKGKRRLLKMIKMFDYKK
jgi:hypothetical protein